MSVCVGCVPLLLSSPLLFSDPPAPPTPRSLSGSHRTICRPLLTLLSFVAFFAFHPTLCWLCRPPKAQKEQLCHLFWDTVRPDSTLPVG